MNASAKDRPDIWMLMVFAVLFVVVVDINSPQRKRGMVICLCIVARKVWWV